MSIVAKVEKEQIEKLADAYVKSKAETDSKVDQNSLKEDFKNRDSLFSEGDLVKVGVKIIEGKKERIQFFEGYVIAKKGHGITRTFKVRKIAYGVGVERTFPLYSPNVDSIEVIKKGKVRRAKLYYLRDRKGKKAKIIEKISFKGKGEETSNS